MSSTRRPARKGERDDYQTPLSAILPLKDFLAPYISRDELFLEPCAGEGRIVQVFGPLFDNADICEITRGIDYLARSCKADWIITNPPFSLALEFLEKSLVEAPNVAYLLRLGFLASQKRREFWQKYPLPTLCTLSERPSFTGNGATDSADYGWFIWSRRTPRGIFVL